jgi:hypothetical protein
LLKASNGSKKKKHAPKGSTTGDQYAWKNIHAPDACHLPEANNLVVATPVKDEKALNYSKVLKVTVDYSNDEDET